jgi:acyl-CoA reductase-like NAD-dependent aldehyde dehydrogenase
VRCLRQLHQALLDNAEHLREILVHEVGAPVSSTHGPQLDGPTEVVRWYADLLERYEFVEDLGELESFGRRNHRWVEKEAAGVVGAIAAYNYPIQLALAKLAPVLAAGCTVVLKGAPDTPWATLALGKLVAEATDIPPGVVNVLTASDNAVGALLTTHPDIDVVSFTGSTPVGRQIMAAASATVKRVFLELGGKSAFVLLDDGDVAMATMFCSYAVISHSGQGCAITSRLVVPRDRYDEVVDVARTVLGSVAYGDPADPANMMGPLISARQREKVAGYVDRAIAEGAKAVIGGRIPEHLPRGFFYEPTVLVGADESSAVAQDELFGPVLVVLPHDGDDDAIRIANNSIFGLSGAVVSGDRERALRVARRSRAGTMSVNGGVYYGPDAPFGGYKQSGIGREMGGAGLAEFLELKTFAEPAS